MNLTQFLSLLSLLVISVSLQAQTTASFQIISTHNEGVPFANLYVLHSNDGTMSDENGYVSLEIQEIAATDTIQISCIGYEDRRVLVSDILELKADKTIQIQQSEYALNTVVVTDKKIKYKTKKVGYNTLVDLCQVSFLYGSQYKGGERGILIRNNRKGRIESVNFNIAYASMDSMRYEVNIYKYENGTIKNVLNTKRIFMTINQGDKKARSINLKDYNIKVDGDFVVSFESLNNHSGDSRLVFKAACFAKDVVMLEKRANGTWIQTKDNLAMAIWCALKTQKVASFSNR